MLGGDFKERTFDVNINGVAFLEDLSNKEYFEPEKAISFRTTVTVNNKNGIVIDFIPKKGETILNGVQLRKLR